MQNILSFGLLLFLVLVSHLSQVAILIGMGVALLGMMVQLIIKKS